MKPCFQLQLNASTVRSALPLLGAILITPQTLLAQTEAVEPDPEPDYCLHVCCLCTCQGPRVCDIWDFLAFQGDFVASNPCAIDLDTSTGVGVGDIFDFLAFQQEFIDGMVFGFRC